MEFAFYTHSFFTFTSPYEYCNIGPIGRISLKSTSAHTYVRRIAIATLVGLRKYFAHAHVCEQPRCACSTKWVTVMYGTAIQRNTGRDRDSGRSLS